MTNPFTPFYDAVNHPATAGPAPGTRKTIGYLCSYAPEELIFAAGCHPMRLFSSKSDIQLSENHLQSYCCSLVRGILEDGLAGRLECLDGIVFPHTCDSIQRLSDIFRLNIKISFFADVVLPVNLTSQASKDYMGQVLDKFKSDLETWTGIPITAPRLAASIALFNRIRKSLARIYDIKSQTPAIINGKDLYTVIKASMLMDREVLADRLDTLIQTLESQSASPTLSPASPKRLILSGSVCDMPDLYTLIEGAGAAVVGDDLCSGQRWFEGLVPEDIPPMAGLTARYTERIICPAKHSGTRARSKALIHRVREKKADGVVFTLLKFCDPHAFDYPYLTEELDRAGVRHLLLEMDDSQDSTGQMATRLETFIHMI